MNFCTLIFPKFQNIWRKPIVFCLVLLVAIAVLFGVNASARAETGAQYYAYSVSVENHNGYAYMSRNTNLPNIGYNDWIALYDHSPQSASDLQSNYLGKCWFWALRRDSYQTDCSWRTGLYAVYVGKRQTRNGFDYFKLAEAGPTRGDGSCD